jgi:hypothetical protein
VNQQKTEQTDDKLMQTQVLTLQRYSTYLRVYLIKIKKLHNINHFMKLFLKGV